jgi:hypothetical protein
VRAPEQLRGTRFVAAPEVLDSLPLPDERAIPRVYLRLAEDDLLVIHPGSMVVSVGDEPLVQEQEAGFVGWWLAPDELDHVVTHIDWPLPAERPALAQGLVAGVPAKLWLAEDRALLLCAAAYAHELEERL